MTTFSEDPNQAQYQIRGFKPGTIQINEKKYTRSVIIAPNQLIEDWSPQTIAEVSAESLQPILAFKPDILLIGTGKTLTFISATIYGELINQGIGVEVMNTQSACSTYNALSAENRNVMAALILD